jgi:hypothetical protein
MDKVLNGLIISTKLTTEEKASAILKLFKQEMLRLIGKNERKSITMSGYTESFIEGKNTLRAELRKKVGE